ncbi:TIGR01457 family HAD-type hydrolase [Tenuibacillus multivorans]|uniref:4-nitrophenyl phosphatase n=1 Tax=Tenuibacillus multivorans TaxID=237069 RepID=A0A1H0FTV5_9BACI|nr:TIGR01457 family HAD-type hydrolase [Tenuibacillus multivorans]GEL77885.1 haloacid dehalogenase [Tenuibacillus multivorans]SDN97991.1 4-nitrophenyl phosphatase [Tenuibacillus multivorans]
MKHYKAYLIDLDGTMYRGKQPIPEAKVFIDELKFRQIPFMFVTNNSSRTPELTQEKLINFGIEAESVQIMTASLATASLIKEEKPDATAFVIGEDGIIKALEDKGIKVVDKDPDYVVMGIDRDNTYKKLVEACVHLQNGATFIATNPDIKVPTEKGFVPGNGAFATLVENVTGMKPEIVGKPTGHMLYIALEQLGVEPSDAIMVGDNYQTDIQAGIRANMDTLHVQTGVTSQEELRQYSVQPTYSIKTLADWFD